MSPLAVCETAVAAEMHNVNHTTANIYKNQFYVVMLNSWAKWILCIYVQYAGCGDRNRPGLYQGVSHSLDERRSQRREETLVQDDEYGCQRKLVSISPLP